MQFSDQWNTVKVIGTKCLLERGAAILGNSAMVGVMNNDDYDTNGGGWRVLPENHANYVINEIRYYNYIGSNHILKVGYKEATHYHIEDIN